MVEFWIEFFMFLKDRKRYWMAPVIVIIMLLGILIVLGQGTVLMPFVYTLV